MQSGEVDRYDSALGAVILANVDRDAAKETYEETEDDHAHRKVDWEDEIVNGVGDLADLGKLRFGKLGLANVDIPDDMVVSLEIVNPEGDDTGLDPGEKVVIYNGCAANAVPVIGGSRTQVVWKKNPVQGEFNISNLAGKGFYIFGIEGWEAGTEIVVRETIKIGATAVLKDEQHILTAPLLFLNNLDPVIRLAASRGPDGDPDFAEFKAAVDACGAPQIDWIAASSGVGGSVVHFRSRCISGWAIF
jgi:hypothetical protein